MLIEKDAKLDDLMCVTVTEMHVAAFPKINSPPPYVTARPHGERYTESPMDGILLGCLLS